MTSMSPSMTRSGGKLECLPLSCDTQQDDAAARTYESGRQVDRLDRTRRLDDEVERASGQPMGRGDSVLLGHVDDGVRPERPREVELFGSHSVGEDGTRRVQAREPESQRAERADPDDADRLTRTRTASLERAEHARPRLDQHAGRERDRVRAAGAPRVAARPRTGRTRQGG